MTHRFDVAVVGDGPAGSALASALRRLDVGVVLVGLDAEWTATYSTWIDDLDRDVAGKGFEPLLDDPTGVLSTRLETVLAHAAGRHLLDRPYGVFDNAALRSVLRRDVEHLVGRVAAVPSPTRVVLDGAEDLHAGLVVDATGWPPAFAGRRRSSRRIASAATPAWQTAIGVVLDEPPDGDLGEATFMDFRPVTTAGDRTSTVGPLGVTTFCYALPVRDGWMVEETVLAARPAIEPIALLPRLSARLGRHPDELLASARRTEYVRIPMGGRLPDRDDPVVAFGAAAGYVHAATGFSVAASIRAAPRVAATIAEQLGRPAVDAAVVADAVWPASLRRTRVLHDYGLDTLLRLDPTEVGEFFGAFFSLPVERWSAYLRIDTPPAEVAAVMTEVFRNSSWSLRRRLMSSNPTTFARLLRPG